LAGQKEIIYSLKKEQCRRHSCGEAPRTDGMNMLFTVG